MSHYITETCLDVKDGGCVDVCPVDCIHPRPDEADFATERMLYIDKDNCIDCGICVDECPVGAIFPEFQLPQAQLHFVELNDAYFARRKAGG
jgi:NAD-dependent dihydropyrimidine dehydrogenase PreA subunit